MGDRSEFIVCPYNVTHMIIKSRMASHLIKCRQQHVGETYVTCPLNATHDVPEPELQYHVKVCPDKATIEKFIYVMEEPKPIGDSVSIEVPDCTENWDEQVTNSYLKIKEEVLQKSLVLRQPVGKSKSKKKEFYKEEMRKFGEGSSSRNLEEDLN